MFMFMFMFMYRVLCVVCLNIYFKRDLKNNVFKFINFLCFLFCGVNHFGKRMADMRDNDKLKSKSQIKTMFY